MTMARSRSMKYFPTKQIAEALGARADHPSRSKPANRSGLTAL